MDIFKRFQIIVVLSQIIIGGGILLAWLLFGAEMVGHVLVFLLGIGTIVAFYSTIKKEGGWKKFITDLIRS